MSKLDDLHPDLRKRVRALQKAAPWPIGITSGYRSTQRQRELWEAWQRRDPGANPANRPGTSKHERTLDGKPAAEAVDLDFPGARGSKAHAEAVAWVHGNAHLFGLHFPIRREDWHAESNGRPFDPSPPAEELDMDADTLRQIVREEVGRQVTLLLRGEQDGKKTGHTDHLKQIRADIAALDVPRKEK